MLRSRKRECLAAPGPLLCHEQCCSYPTTTAATGDALQSSFAILQFPLVTKLHMFRKLNLCRRLVVPSQKIRSDLYIALHKFLVNLYNHLERESLLAPQRAVAAAATETAGFTRLCQALQEEGKGKKHLCGVPTGPAWRESQPREMPSPEAQHKPSPFCLSV